ncbi:hypothetical protein PTKIN_Ptkin03bG0062600 [Pterospermum kingtungense]
MEYLNLVSSSASSRNSPDSESSSSADQALPVISHKRKAGRKKFKETRHPVFRGVRQRKGNKWVCEVREPYKKSRIWLGSFLTPEMAARAYDVAALALRGNSAALNFPDSASILPRPKSSSPKDIQTAALAAAEAFRPTNIDHDDQPLGCSSTPLISNENKPCSMVLDLSSILETNNPLLFMDEEALFNMPGLLNSMAEGMLLTPPAAVSQREVLDWDDDTDAIVNYIDLWGDHYN